ncbi:hypothetical protein GpartN1_g776.t1 [Galdieria partita]|uniref:Uncharacterized protein n=1 Tax=Galdieria partita TaxID=83374 RepID=A0A9C7PR71_9RHOD|nr:hypothetical protein GpartN1_g776.t1 [Galdieria partita]
MSDSQCFRVDSSGDTNNLIFESLYKRDVPEYIIQGAICQANTEKTLRAKWALGDSSYNRFYDSKVQRQLKKSSGIRVLKDFSSSELLKEFEPLCSTSPDVDKLQEQVVLQATRLNGELDRDSCNEQLWLQLLDLQNRYYDLGLLNKKSMVDKKLSIVAKALEKIPNSEVLLLRYISIMAGLCDYETMLSLFRRALQCSPTSLNIHLLRFRFALSSFESFSLYSMETICREAFDCLCSNNFAYGLYFVILFIRILFHSGWKQKAVGIFQAISEFLCFRIDNRIDLPIESNRLRKFGEKHLFIFFWKSFAPRIGEMPRHNWTDWLVTFLKTLENHYEQIEKLENYEDSDGESSSSSSLEEFESPAKLPSVEEREEDEQEWIESDASSSTAEVSDSSLLGDRKDGELDLMLTSRIAGSELKEWILEEETESSKDSFEFSSLEHLLQHDSDSLYTLFGSCAEFYCLPRDIAQFIPQSCNVDRSICYQVVMEFLLSLRGWPFLDSITTLIPLDLQNIQLKEETLSSSFSLSSPRDIEVTPSYLGMSLFRLFDQTQPSLRDMNRLLSEWLLGNGYFHILKNNILKENVPVSFISNIYDSVIFSKASIFYYGHLAEGDSYSLRIAEAFIFFEGTVGGFSKGRSAAKRLLKTCENFSLYTSFAELLVHENMLQESESVYKSCLSRLNDSSWKGKECCRVILSFLFYLLNYVNEDWTTRRIKCQNVFRVFIGKFGSSEEAVSFTEKMMIKNKLQKLINERILVFWSLSEEMHHFSVLACQLVFEWLFFGVERARDVLHSIENELLVARQRKELTGSVYSVVHVKLRQLLCLFAFLDWEHSGESSIRVIRNCLEEALEKYPGDELLLFMYAFLFRFYSNRSMSLHILFNRISQRSNVSAMTVVAQIVAEGVSLTGQEKVSWNDADPSSRRRVTSLLTRSLYETSLACSSVLWLQFLTMLYSQRKSIGNHGEVLKKAFYRALTHIPYSKELVLTSFKFLSDSLSIQEARDIWSIAREKGLLFNKSFPYADNE